MQYVPLNKKRQNMDYKHIILTPQQLTEFKLGLKEGKLWSIIYTLLKEPDQ